MKADAVVIGGGCAGLSAAVRLADAGLKVVVVESGPRLGGRASTFTDPVIGERVDNGQHVLFGCYYETFDFLRRIGTARLAPIGRSLTVTMVGPAGPRTLTCPSWPPPWHLVGGLLQWRAIPIRDRLNAWKVAKALRDRNGTSDTMSVADWLNANGQSSEICRWLWYPLAIAALNQSPQIAQAATFVRVLDQLFAGAPEDAAIAVPTVPLEELYAAPARKFLEERDAIILMKCTGRIAIGESGAVTGVVAGDVVVHSDAVISAVPWHAFPQVWHGRCPSAIEPVCAAAASMSASPIVTANLWFDDEIDIGAPLVGIVHGRMHWVFDKRVIFGETARHVALVSSGADALAALENGAIVDAAVDDLRQVIPDISRRRLVRSVVVRERRATFSLASSEPARPPIDTAVPGLYMAGDWVDTGLPATIESAVLSGHRAADRLLGKPQASS